MRAPRTTRAVNKKSARFEADTLPSRIQHSLFYRCEIARFSPAQSAMSNPHVPQGRHEFVEEDPWPHDAAISPPVDYSSPLLPEFERRVNYCQSLAAHLAGRPGLGVGWQIITFARFAPLFVHKDDVTMYEAMARRYVLDALRRTRVKLEANRARDSRFTEYNQTGWIARVLVGPFWHCAAAQIFTGPLVCRFTSTRMRCKQSQ